jgi:AraC family transcriptional regulator of adaptative response/methylated-DNA-[protein]-cysteine methyltransferase
MNAFEQPDYLQRSQEYALVEKALIYVDQHAHRQPELKEVAEAVGLSEFHFQRLFTHWAGISPKRFLQFMTRERAREWLDRSASLLDTSIGVGLSSPGRLHDLFITTEAVTPGEYKTRGAGLTIRYGLFPSPFGTCLIGTTNRGICHLGFVQGREGDAVDELFTRWQQAQILEDSTAAGGLVDAVFSLGSPGVPLHVLLRGTNFQIKVWEALLRIPPAGVVTYEELARLAGSPAGVRAVASAVARNPVPVVIPCHRVIRKLGDFGQYRYGPARKKALLGWEMANAELSAAAL